MTAAVRLHRPIIGVGGALRGMSLWLPLTDSGSGAVNLAPARAAGSATATFTRATTAWTKLSSGFWQQVASGTARSCYLGADTTVSAYGGYLSEAARTNECLQARDLSDASWTKSNVTALLDQSGIDGRGNRASSLEATAANGTVKQAITSASAARRFSVFMKRITGTGNIDLTLDNGTTWTTVSGSINSATFTRVAIGQTVTNPTVGIRIVTSGDKVAVDMAQEEVGDTDTSPIPTTTGSATRNADVLLYAAAGNLPTGTNPVTAYAEFVENAASTANQQAILHDSTGGNTRFNLDADNSAGNSLFVYGTGSSTATIGVVMVAAGASHKVAVRCGPNGGAYFLDGVAAGSAPTSATASNLGTPTFIGIAVDGKGTNKWLNGSIKNVKLWSRALSDGEIAAL